MALRALALARRAFLAAALAALTRLVFLAAAKRF